MPSLRGGIPTDEECHGKISIGAVGKVNRVHGPKEAEGSTPDEQKWGIEIDGCATPIHLVSQLGRARPVKRITAK